MSGDVQPRKRKDKRRKKADGEYTVQRVRGASFDDEDGGTPPPTLLNPSESAADNLTIHVHKEGGTGGHWCARIIFFALLAILVGLIGVILLEHRGTTDIDTPVTESRWATIFDGWVDDASPTHDDEPQVGPKGDHEEVSEEGEEHEEASEEVDHADEEEAANEEVEDKDSKEDNDEDEGIGSEGDEESTSAEEDERGESVEREQGSEEQEEEDHDEGIDQGETDSDHNEDAALEEVDHTSGEEDDSAVNEEDDIINVSDNELDTSIEGIKASSKQQSDDDTSDDFLGIRGVNEIDDNSYEPLEEEIESKNQSSEDNSIQDESSEVTIKDGSNEEAKDDVNDLKENQENNHSMELDYKEIGHKRIMQQQIHSRSYDHNSKENHSPKLNEDTQLNAANTIVNHDIAILNTKNTHNSIKLNSHEANSIETEDSDLDDETNWVNSSNDENFSEDEDNHHISTATIVTESDNNNSIENPNLRDDFSKENASDHNRSGSDDSGENSDEHRNEIDLLIDTKVTHEVDSDDTDEAKNPVTEIEILSKAQFCEKPGQCEGINTDLKTTEPKIITDLDITIQKIQSNLDIPDQKNQINLDIINQKMLTNLDTEVPKVQTNLNLEDPVIRNNLDLKNAKIGTNLNRNDLETRTNLDTKVPKVQTNFNSEDPVIENDSNVMNAKIGTNLNRKHPKIITHPNVKKARHKSKKSLAMKAFKNFFDGKISELTSSLQEGELRIENDDDNDMNLKFDNYDEDIESGEMPNAETIKLEDEEPEEVVNDVEIEPEPEKVEEESTGVAVKFGVGVALVVAAHFVLVRRWNNGDVNATRTPSSGEEGPDLSRRNTIIPPPHIQQVVATIATEEDQEVRNKDDQTQEYEDLRSKYKKLDHEDDREEVVIKMSSGFTAASNPVKGLQMEKTPTRDIWAEHSLAREEPKPRVTAPGKDTSEEEDEEELETSEGERVSGTEEDEEEEEDDCGIEDIDDSELVAKLEAKYGKLPTPPESEDEDDDYEDEEDDEDDMEGWKQVKVPTDSQSDSEDEPKTTLKPVVRTKQQEKDLSGAKDYVFANISNPGDLVIREKIDSALTKPIQERIEHFTELLLFYPVSPRTRYELARAYDDLAQRKKSNKELLKSIVIYQSVLDLGLVVPASLYKVAAERCIKCMRFTGQNKPAEEIHDALIRRFPNEPQYRNQLVVTLLIQSKWKTAKNVLARTLRRWPGDGFALVHMGFVMKIGVKNMVKAAEYLQAGIATGHEATIDGRFYFHLGDALARIGKQSEALQVYQKGADYGLFRSAYQRSLYNIERLTGRPWWTFEQTTYEKFLQSLEENWRIIKAEGLTAMYKTGQFKNEEENLIDAGVWKQFILYTRGRKVVENCDQVPRTCSLIDRFPPAAKCRRGQAKFSVMFPGTHVWPHCGPTNCRLRAHLGLSGSKGTFIRVGDEVREWEDGKAIVFDDSFEHEVWHNGTQPRLVLIVDVWHPELTDEEKNSLPEL